MVSDVNFSRRNLMALAGSAVAVAAIPAQMKAPTEKPDNSQPHPDAPNERIGYAVVGIGEIASTQAVPAFGKCKHSKITALVTGEPTTKGAAYARELGISPASVYNYQSFDRIVDNPDIKAVYIALPNSMHAEFTVRAAKAGKHVLCEKPMANSTEDCGRMIEACKAAGKRLMIAYRQQYEPYNREVVRMARAGELGSLRTLVAVNGQNQGSPGQWRQKLEMSGGGSLVDVGVYCLNAARFITGEEPIQIVATASTDHDDPRFREVEDRISFTLVFPSGFMATLMSFYSGHYTQMYRLTGSELWAELNPAFSYHGLQLRTSYRKGNSERNEQIQLEDADQFANEIDHFSRCIKENRIPHTPGEEGAQDIRLVKSIYEAAQTGQVMHLPKTSGVDVFRGSAPTF